MAARSEGIFPREGFNLDNSFEITTAPETAPVTMANCRTLRVVCVGFDYTAPTGDYSEPRLYYRIGSNEDHFITADDVDPNGVFIAHHRGYSMPANNIQLFTVGSSGLSGTPGTISYEGVYVELVDGPAR